jgi:CBS domain-containing protein
MRREVIAYSLPGREKDVAMRAMDLMTTEVIAVEPDTSVKALAALLSERGISGVPVVDADNRVVGIVSEGDLLHRVKTGTEQRPDGRAGRRRSWWLEGIASDRELARDYVKSHGRTVRDVMTREAVVVSDTTELADIVILLETKKIKRVPVVRDGKLVGIVSRANLVRALATTKSAPVTIADPGDRAIGDQLLAELRGKKWVDISSADIIVRDRIVHLWFSDDQPQEERLTFRVAAENIPGVLRVEEHIVAAPALEAAPASGEGQT